MRPRPAISGRRLAPAIAGRFEALTERRYEGVRLTAAARHGRPRRRRSSAINRADLRRHARAALDLVPTVYHRVPADDRGARQSTSERRGPHGLVSRAADKKSAELQIVVFTCRPGDYLPAHAIGSPGSSVRRIRLVTSSARSTWAKALKGRWCRALPRPFWSTYRQR